MTELPIFDESGSLVDHPQWLTFFHMCYGDDPDAAKAAYAAICSMPSSGSSLSKAAKVVINDAFKKVRICQLVGDAVLVTVWFAQQGEWCGMRRACAIAAGSVTAVERTNGGKAIPTSPDRLRSQLRARRNVAHYWGAYRLLPEEEAGNILDEPEAHQSLLRCAAYLEGILDDAWGTDWKPLRVPSDFAARKYAVEPLYFERFSELISSYRRSSDWR